MTIYELIKDKLHPALIVALEHDITPQDIRFLPMVEDVLRLRDEGHDNGEAVKWVALKYNITIQYLYRILNKFEREI